MLCGKEFYRVSGHAKRAKPGKFCSRQCFSQWEKGENNPTYQGGNVRCTCEICGSLFFVKPSYLEKGGGAGRFCSVKCRASGIRAESHPRHVEKVSVQCEICGKVVALSPSHAEGKRFALVAARERQSDKKTSGPTMVDICMAKPMRHTILRLRVDCGDKSGSATAGNVLFAELIAPEMASGRWMCITSITTRRIPINGI